MDWHLLSPFDLSRILLVGGSLLVPHSLPGPPVASDYYLARPGWVVSISGSPNRESSCRGLFASDGRAGAEYSKCHDRRCFPEAVPADP